MKRFKTIARVLWMYALVWGGAVQAALSLPLHTESIMHPDSYHIIQLDQELFMVHVDAENEDTSCQYRVYNFPATINQAGLFRLAGDITQELTINSSNVTVDFSGHRISGGSNGVSILSGLSNIALLNGTIADVAGNGIQINTGCRSITVRDMGVKNSVVGINAEGVRDSIIRNCTLTHNYTGIECIDCTGVVIGGCIAQRNSNGGFCLVTSSTCLIQDCQAINTGETNTETTQQTIFGFGSANGSANSFERCIANGTQGNQITDAESIIAGFILRGTETSSKIILSEAANTRTNSGGQTTPHGILVEQLFSGLDDLVDSTIDTNTDIARKIDWSPDGGYLVVPTNRASNDELLLYRFDRSTGSLVLVDSINPDGGVSGGDNLEFSRWHPSGNFLAVGAISLDPGPDEAALVYAFNRDAEKLTEVARSDVSTRPNKVSWSPDGRYLAVGDQLDVTITIYSFDAVALTLTNVVSAGTGGSTVGALAWSPDLNYVVVSGTGATGLVLYRFDASDGTLTSIDTFATSAPIVEVNWTQDGRYLAAVGSLISAGNDLVIFRFDPENTSSELTLVDSDAQGIVRGGGHWTADGKYIALADASGSDGVVRVYRFDRSTESLDSPTSLTLAGTSNLQSTRWSPDGKYLVAAGTRDTGDALYIFDAFTGPSKNVIKDTIVYCNSGGSIPSGVGISGSSIENMIIGNTSYNNPENPFLVFQNYTFVTNVFNPLFGHGPMALQNVSVTTPIQTPLSIALAAQQIENKLCDIYTKIDNLVP